MAIEPPWASTNRLAVERPNPVPRDFVVKNGVNSFSRTFGGIPGPLSATAIVHISSDALTATRMPPFPCTAWTAFNSRFCRISFSSSASA